MTTQSDLVICPRLRLGDEIVGTVTMVARFGATRAVTLDELRVELIFPADEASDAWFRSADAAEAPEASRRGHEHAARRSSVRGGVCLQDGLQQG